LEAAAIYAREDADKQPPLIAAGIDYMRID